MRGGTAGFFSGAEGKMKEKTFCMGKFVESIDKNTMMCYNARKYEGGVFRAYPYRDFVDRSGDLSFDFRYSKRQ